MSRPRRPEDWQRDVANARPGEAELSALLRQDQRLTEFRDHTLDFDRLDFSFVYDGDTVTVDLKEKRSRYSAGVQALWSAVAERDLFIVDETVYRRIVWQGGGGYLVVHDLPATRWLAFGPWELTLGPRVRYQRRGQLTTDFLKGKVLLNLSRATDMGSAFSVDSLLDLITATRRDRDQVGAVGVGTERLPIV